MAVGGVVLATSLVVVPVVDVNLFVRLFPPLGAIATVVMLTGVGSPVRARKMVTMLSIGSWHRVGFRYLLPVFTGPVVEIHEKGRYRLRWTVLWRIARGGLPRASHADVVMDPSGQAVVRAPGNDELFLAIAR